MAFYRIASDGGFKVHTGWIAELVKRGAYLQACVNALPEYDLRHTARSVGSVASDRSTLVDVWKLSSERPSATRFRRGRSP